MDILNIFQCKNNKYLAVYINVYVLGHNFKTKTNKIIDFN